MELNQDTLAELVATKLAKEYDFTDRIESRVRDHIDKLIDGQIKAATEKMISDALARVMENWQELKLRRTNNWGDPEGDPISLPQWVENYIFSRMSTTQNWQNREFSNDLKEAIKKAVLAHAGTLIADSQKQFIDAVNGAMANGLKIKGT
jgi:hypothetical protein